MKKKKLRVAVLYGGKSAEREISIRTGQQIIKHLDRKKYYVLPIEVPRSDTGWVLRLLAAKPDVAFIALHGPLGKMARFKECLRCLEFPTPFPAS